MHVFQIQPRMWSGRFTRLAQKSSFTSLSIKRPSWLSSLSTWCRYHISSKVFSFVALHLSGHATLTPERVFVQCLLVDCTAGFRFACNQLAVEVTLVQAWSNVTNCARGLSSTANCCRPPPWVAESCLYSQSRANATNSSRRATERSQS